MALIKFLKQKAKELKQECYALYLAYKHPGTPRYAKILIGLTLFYLLSPIDLIPDFIPILGYVDDLLIVPLLIALSIKLIPPHILRECRKQAREKPMQLKRKWPAAIMVISIWIVVLVFITRWQLHKFSSTH